MFIKQILMNFVLQVDIRIPNSLVLHNLFIYVYTFVCVCT